MEIKKLLLETNIVNNNGKLYPKDVVLKALDNPYIQERLKTFSLMGEAGHPIDSNPKRQLTIDQSNVSHIIKEFTWEDNILYGTIVSANTEKGRDLENLCKQGFEPNFALRARGSIEKIDGVITVTSPLDIISFDWVAKSSHVNSRNE